MARYLMYLRKSRMDTDFEEVSVEETLSRHRQILEKYCREKKLNVVEVLEEVVSGESLACRPKMMRLLELINTGAYDGVVCMDIERLSRGSSMEAGYIMQILQTNGCKIVTPGKTYDLQNESDEQFTDMKFMFSRYELKTITKRLVRGRNQSASEGKYLGSMAPYGYRIYKLPGEKGNSLRIDPEEAKVVRMIYDLYTQGMGYNTIAYKLNQLNIPSHTGQWGATSIANILRNEVYLGQIRWRHDPVKKLVKDGMLTKKRVYNPDYELYNGRHEAIITEEQWERVKEMQASRSNAAVNVGRELKNPFATILRCEHCGAPMKRKTPPKGKPGSPWYACPNRDCHSRNIKCETVENAIVDAMRDWLENYTIQLQQEPQSRTDTTETELEAVRGQLVQLQAQQDTICEYLEKGIYTVDMFTKRNSALSRDIKKLQTTEAALLKRQASGRKNDRAQQELIPLTQHILDNYALLTIPEKNRLWKLVMKKATISKSEDDTISLHIYPNLPK